MLKFVKILLKFDKKIDKNLGSWRDRIGSRASFGRRQGPMGWDDSDDDEWDAKMLSNSYWTPIITNVTFDGFFQYVF